MEFYLIPILDTNIWFNYSRILGLSVPLWPPPLVPQFWRKTLLPQNQHPITFIIWSCSPLSFTPQSIRQVRCFVYLSVSFCLSLKFVHLNVFQCLSVLLSVCLFPSIIVRPSVSPFVCKTSFCLFVWLSVCLIITDLMKIKIKDNYWFTVWKMAGISCGFTFITRSKSLYINSYCIQFLSFIFYIQML